MNWDFNLNWAQILDVMFSCLIILAIVYISFIILKRMIQRVVVGKTQNPRLQTLASLLSNFIGYILFFIALVALLSQFGIDATGLIAGAGILGLAIGFGAQGLVSDIVTGFFILLEDQVNVGDHITVNTFSGIVEQTGLRVLKIRGLNGDLHFVPNRELKSITNHSKGTSNTIVDIKINVKNELDIKSRIAEIQASLNQLTEELPQIVDGPSVLDEHSPNKADKAIRIIAKTKPNKGEEITEKLKHHAKQLLKTETDVVV